MIYSVDIWTDGENSIKIQLTGNKEDVISHAKALGTFLRYSKSKDSLFDVNEMNIVHVANVIKNEFCSLQSVEDMSNYLKENEALFDRIKEWEEE